MDKIEKLKELNKYIRSPKHNNNCAAHNDNCLCCLEGKNFQEWFVKYIDRIIERG